MAFVSGLDPDYLRKLLVQTRSEQKKNKSLASSKFNDENVVFTFNCDSSIRWKRSLSDQTSDHRRPDRLIETG